MCPLRLILIFLSATLAGFLVLRNLKSPPHSPDSPAEDSPDAPSTSNSSQFSKFRSALVSVFWTGVDMASGRYLWRHFVSSSSSSKLDD